MSTNFMRKLIALGPAWVIHEQSKPDGPLQKYDNNRDYLAVANPENYVKLWAPWNSIFPNANGLDANGDVVPGLGPGEGVNTSGRAVLDRLDYEIASVRADNRWVILTSYQFPWWSNGTGGINSDTIDDWNFQPWDRAGMTLWRAFQASGFSAKPDNWSIKPTAFKLPTDGFGVDSAFGRWMKFLYKRYNPAGPSAPTISVRGTMVQPSILALEFVNEPNLQLWPQCTPPANPDVSKDATWQYTSDNIGCQVAQMWQTAMTIGTGYGNTISVYGPGTADTVLSNSTRLTTKYDDFTEKVLSTLVNANHRGGFFNTWTQHNYQDGLAPLGGGATRAGNTQSRLQNRWTGYSENGIASVFLTEGSVVKDAHHSITETQRQQLIAAAYASVLNDEILKGRGIGMFPQYLYYTTTSPADFDSGLVNTDAGHTKRPAFDTFKGFRTI